MLLASSAAGLAAPPSPPLPPSPPPVAARVTPAIALALAAVDRADYAEVERLRPDLSDLERRLVDWTMMRRNARVLTTADLERIEKDLAGWPSLTLLPTRLEQAVLREQPAPARLFAFFTDRTPLTIDGLLALARAYRAAGDDVRAAALVTRIWRKEMMEPVAEARFREEFGGMLGRDDDVARLHLLLYADRAAQAAVIARRLGEDYLALMRARAAVSARRANAPAMLEAVPKALADDPIYRLARAEHFRHTGQPRLAGEELVRAAPLLGPQDDAEIWWIERRITSRDLMERGEAALAYEVAAGQHGGDPTIRVEAAFHAGWYALRFLDDPKKALPHFEELERIATRPISRSRAKYWIARAHEAAGNELGAELAYRAAARDQTTYYGQLALLKRGEERLSLPPLPVPDETDRAAFDADERVRALRRLTEIGRDRDAALFYRPLAETLSIAGCVLLARFAENNGDHSIALQVGKDALDRDPSAVRLAYPLEAIPEASREGTHVEAGMVYAIARQESGFNPAAVSRAGALGLLQMLPGTARRTASGLGLPFFHERLTSDAAYNALLGSAHLGELVDRFRGSYVLTFAAYNAGPGKAAEWVRRFGDPQAEGVDVVDWVEKISYGETRSYVQRVMENLQVYRTLLGEEKLRIAEDLRR